MGNIIRWSIPDLTEVTYTKAYVYKSNSKNGGYSNVSVQDIIDNTFFDETGTNNDWYKVQFRIGSDGIFSELSDPIRGGTFNGYCSVYDIRNFAKNLTSNKVSDTILYEYIKFANARINEDISVVYRDERVRYISLEKHNRVDGVNKTFYVKEPFIGDFEDNGVIDENEISVYGIDSNNNRIVYQVESIDSVELGKYTLSVAPQMGIRLYHSYKSVPVLLYPSVNRLVRLAAINYVLSLAFSSTDPGQVKSFRVNKVSITGEMSPAKKYGLEYATLVSKIVSTPVKERSANSGINYDIYTVV